MTTYRELNAAWSQHSAPTPQEAISGTKRLLRRALRLAIEDGAVHSQYRLPKRRFKITSGRRQTWPRSGVWYVNPNERGQGWMEIVHSVSHWAQRRFWPNEDPHAPRHIWIEKELADYAIKNFLAGQLKRPERPRVKPNPVDKRRARVSAAIKRWEAKQRRAVNALRKLRQQERYYDRRTRHPGLSETGTTDAGATRVAQA